MQMPKVLCATTTQVRRAKLSVGEGDVVADCSGGCGADCVVSAVVVQSLKDVKCGVYCDRCFKAGRPAQTIHVFH